MVILAPFTSAFLGANVAVRGNYWTEWGLWFFSGSLAFLVVTPAVVALFNLGREDKKIILVLLEAAVLLAGLVVFGYLTLVASGENSPPALLYSLLPFLLWPALRFGSGGVSISMIVLTFLSIWGATHDRGPFAELGMLHNVLSLQMFLIFAAIPFMCLAALVEERKQRRRGTAKRREATPVGSRGRQIGGMGMESQERAKTLVWLGTRTCRANLRIVLESYKIFGIVYIRKIRTSSKAAEIEARKGV